MTIKKTGGNTWNVVAYSSESFDNLTNEGNYKAVIKIDNINEGDQNGFQIGIGTSGLDFSSIN